MIRLLLALALAGQAVLPAVHEWREAQAETAFHQGQPSDARDRVSSQSGHEHHDPLACPVCPLACRQKIVQDGISIRPPRARAAERAAGSPAHARSPLLAAPASRGPPHLTA